MSKHFRAFLLLLTFMMVFTGTASAFEGKTVEILFSENNNAFFAKETKATSVAEFLREQGITVGEFDTIDPPVHTTLKKGLRVAYVKAITVKVRVDNSEFFKVVKTTPQTLAAFTESYSKRAGIDYTLESKDWHKTMEEGMIIDLSSARSEKFTHREGIDFVIETVYTDTLERGVQLTHREGVKGEKQIITEVHYYGGIEKERKVIEEKVVKEPISKVIHVGTKLPKNVKRIGNDEFEFKQELTMSATAYTADYASTGKNPGDPGFGICATGMRAQVGVVAVDPRVIPLYTKLYIEGYGYAVAGDTGGAIKGHKIDLYYNTSQEANNFGRQTRKVYILAD